MISSLLSNTSITPSITIHPPPKVTKTHHLRLKPEPRSTRESDLLPRSQVPVEEPRRPDKSPLLTATALKALSRVQSSRRTTLDSVMSRVLSRTRSLGSHIRSFKEKNPIITIIIIAVAVSLLAPALLPVLL